MACRRALAAHAGLLFATVSFSIWNVVTERVGSEDVTSMASTIATNLILCAIRDTTALLVFWGRWLLVLILARWQHEPDECADRNESPRGCRDWGLIAIIGAAICFGAFGSVLCSAWIGGDMLGIYSAVCPAASSLLATVCGFERPSRLSAFGVLLGVASGILALAFSPSKSTGATASNVLAGNLTGVALVLWGAFFFVAMKLLFTSSLTRRAIPASTVIRAAYTFATAVTVLCLVVCMAVQGVSRTMDGWEMRDTWMGIFGGIICGALNFSLLTWGNQVLPVTICAIYAALSSPVTAVIAFCTKGEALTLVGYISCVLATLSVVVVSWSGSDGDKQGQPIDDTLVTQSLQDA